LPAHQCFTGQEEVLGGDSRDATAQGRQHPSTVLRGMTGKHDKSLRLLHHFGQRSGVEIADHWRFV
jgi:hypothetical protein